MTTPPDPFASPQAGDPTPPPGYPAAPTYGAPAAPYGQPQQPYGQPQQQWGQPQQQWGGPPPYGAPVTGPVKNGFGVTALVVGIVGLLLCAVPVLGLVLGITAIVFAVLGRKRAGRGEATNGGMAIAGLVLGILATIGGLAITTVLVFFGSSISDLTDCLQTAQRNETNNIANNEAARRACSDQFSHGIQNR